MNLESTIPPINCAAAAREGWMAELAALDPEETQAAALPTSTSSELHESDLSLIFPKLSLPVLWQARATCRTWRDASSADARMARLLLFQRRQQHSSMFVQVYMLHRFRWGEFEDNQGSPVKHHDDRLGSLKYACAHDPVRDAWFPALVPWEWGFRHPGPRHLCGRFRPTAPSQEVVVDGTMPGGLVFFHARRVYEKLSKLQVYVIDPMLRGAGVTALPVLHHHGSSSVQVRVIPDPEDDGAYSVLAAVAVVAWWWWGSLTRIHTYVFRSLTWRWSRCSLFPKQDGDVVAVGPSLNGSVFCYYADDWDFNDTTGVGVLCTSLWRFNPKMKGSKWSQVAVPDEVMMQDIFSFELVEHAGRLLMVAAYGELMDTLYRYPERRTAVRQVDAIKVWEIRVVDRYKMGRRGRGAPRSRSLDETSYIWSLVGELPDTMFQYLKSRLEKHWDVYYCLTIGITGKRFKVFDLVAAGQCLYLSIDRTMISTTSVRLGIDGARVLQEVAVFDTLEQSWRWLNRPEHLAPPPGYSMSHAFCFEA